MQNKTLWAELKEKMLARPTQLISEKNTKICYAELVVLVEDFTKKIRGIDCCAIVCRSEIRSAIALLACFAEGVTALPLAMRYGKIHCQNILDSIDPNAMIIDIDGYLQVVNISDAKYTAPENKPALMICTSGTTGKPKIIMLHEENILSNIKAIQNYFKITQEDTICISRSLYHVAVLTGEFLVSLFQGVKIYFYIEEFVPQCLISELIKENITVFCGTPTMFSLLIAHKRREKINLKTLCVSGESLSEVLAKKMLVAFPDASIYHAYGLSEASPRVSCLLPEDFIRYSDFVGRPLNGVRVKITRNNGSLAKTGEAGMLWVKGDNVMKGYYNNNEMTKEVLLNGWLKTGDIAMQNKQRYLKILGREDHLIIRAGMNIYPEEIEHALKKDRRVAEDLAYEINSQREPWEREQAKENIRERIAKIGLKVIGGFSSIEDVRLLCLQVLPPYQMPNKIELVASLPKNNSGKLLR